MFRWEAKSKPFSNRCSRTSFYPLYANLASSTTAAPELAAGGPKYLENVSIANNSPRYAYEVSGLLSTSSTLRFICWTCGMFPRALSGSTRRLPPRVQRFYTESNLPKERSTCTTVKLGMSVVFVGSSSYGSMPKYIHARAVVTKLFCLNSLTT